MAIALVLYGHFAQKSLWSNSGRFGVDVFFSLSGFLMSNILFHRRVPLSIFYKRRISRVFPVFFLFVSVTYLVQWQVNDYFSLSEFLYTITFLRTYLPPTPDIWHTGIPIGHLWSLNAEEHSYVFLSLLTLFPFLKGREAPILICIGTFSIVIHYSYIKYPQLAPLSNELGTEAVASHLLISSGYFLVREKFVSIVKPWMPITAFGCAIVCYTQVVPWWASMIVSPFLLAFAVNHLSDAPKYFRSVFAFSFIRLLGIWSFSIYIWQQPFYKYKITFFHSSSGALAMAMIVSLFSFYFFENPIRAWLNKKW